MTPDQTTLTAVQSIVTRYLRPDGGADGGDWRPIETAPMANWGSTDVLISGFLESGVRYVETSDWRPPYKGEPGYWTHHKTTPPTHWQPLPAPPGEPSAMSGAAFRGEIIAVLEAAGYGAFATRELTLTEAVAEMRAIKAEWTTDDPHGDIMRERRAEAEEANDGRAE